MTCVRQHPWHPRLIVLLTLLLTAACTAGEEAPGPTASEEIAQPDVPAGLPVAPAGRRVDLTLPGFSSPTNVTNPLFPVARQESVLLLGRVDGQPFRTEVTLLPDTRIIEWQGRMVETLVSQYNAFLGGRIEEVAYDYYAQADDGSVWYFGEDVFNFQDGSIVDTEGTWIAGRDGPAAMIMPADPRGGDAYRTENTPGLAFEEVTVKKIDQTLDGPLGPVDGGLVVEELHMDGTTEDKTFAPGYGEFYTGGGGDVEALALAVPTDAAPGPVPAELSAIEEGAHAVLDAVVADDWPSASAESERVGAAWRGMGPEEVPRLIEPVMSRALGALERAVGALDAPRARSAAIDVARSSLDLQLRYRPVVEVDLSRFGLWAAQLQVDASAGDLASANGDLFALDYVRDRIRPALGSADLVRIDTLLEELRGAVRDGDIAATVRAGARLEDEVSGLQV